jgi:DNA-binding MarR family transcriptional regulator
MDKMTVSRAIRGLRQRGLVSRQRSSTDARAYLLALTAHGTAAYAEIAPLALALQETVLGELSEEQRALLMTALRTVRAKALSMNSND